MGNTTIIILQIATGAGLLIFWALFFTVGLAPKNAPDSYHDFEHAFPIPDGILSVALIASSVLLLRGNPAGITLSHACAGALVFLGLLDITFNLQNMFARQTWKERFFSAFINLWCVGFGLFILLANAQK
jgi:hypothetical protein